jgi:hypothetical protein
LLFSASGDLLATEERPTGFDWDQKREDESGPEYNRRLAQSIFDAWRLELGWRDQPIQVRYFLHPTRPIFVSDLDQYDVIWYYDPCHSRDISTRKKARERINDWIQNGNFIFRWIDHSYIFRNKSLETPQ